MSKEIRKALSLSKIEFFTTHLSLINCLLPVKMTNKEVELLANFMLLEGDIAEYRFGPTAKKVVMKALNISPSGMSNYIKSLTEKGFLIEKGDIMTIWEILEPNREEQIYMFKLVSNGQ